MIALCFDCILDVMINNLMNNSTHHMSLVPSNFDALKKRYLLRHPYVFKYLKIVVVQSHIYSGEFIENRV